MEKKGDRIPLASMEELNVEGSPQTQAKSTSGKESVSCIAYEMQLTADDDTASLSGSTKFETSKVKIISSQPIRDRYVQSINFFFHFRTDVFIYCIVINFLYFPILYIR